MDSRAVSRRELLLMGSTALAALALLRLDKLVEAYPLRAGEELVPWLDQPAAVPAPAQGVIGQQLVWEELDSWITPTDEFFTIKHFGQPAVDMPGWRLDVAGLVKQPLSLTLDQVKARPRQEVTFTLECSGNNGLPFFTGGIGTATWAGTPLAPLLQESGLLEQGREVVFYAHDIGKQVVRELDLTAPFARSMSIDDGAWMPATINEGAGAEFAWKFWGVDWGSPSAGEHAITSRAVDTARNVQPAMTDPPIATKRTYWESNGQITRRVLVA